MVEKLLVVDGTNTFIRNWAVNPTLNSNGEHVGGTIGTIRSVKYMIRETSPSQVIVVWDGEGGSQKRRGIYKEYKAGRKPKLNRQFDFDTPQQSLENLKLQIEKTKKFLRMLGVLQVEIENIEADDTIAFICKHLRPESEKVIVSTDKDFFQLIDSKTVVYSPTKKKYYSGLTFHEELGVIPENYILIKALKGDMSDNIKGIGGVGDKTAVKLFPFIIDKVCTLKELLEHAEKNVNTNAKYKVVIDNRDLLMSNVELMQLTSPMISAQAAMMIRSSIESEPRFEITEFKLALLCDGLQITDSDFFATFREYKLRCCSEA